MRRVVRFKRYMSTAAVPGDAVYLFSELPERTRLQGPLPERLAPLLDGRYDRPGIVAELGPEFTQARVERALDLLIDRGHVVEVDPDTDARAGGYWELYRLDGDTAVRGLTGRAVDAVWLGGAVEDSADEQFAETARSFGFGTATERSDLTVVFVDDFLQEGLDELNRLRLTDGKPWLLAKPVGSVVWVGPVFVPGRTACWACLAERLTRNNMLRTYLTHRAGRAVPGPSIADVAGTRQLGMRLAGLRVAQWLAGHEEDPTADDGQCSVLTFDTTTLETRRHQLHRRPQCAACGDPGLQTVVQRKPVELGSRPKAATSDGGHRAKDPETFLAECEPLVSPITGVVKQLERVRAADDLYVYHSGQNLAVPITGIHELRAGLRNASAGKGITEAQAKASAVAEAIERYSGVYRGDEARVTASLRELGDDAIGPNELAGYSERQFAERATWNAKGAYVERVCDPLDPDEPIDWTPVWSVTAERHRYLPTASLFYGYPARAGHVHAVADSNGNAAGTSLEDAALQGFLELVERDSVAIWWYNRIQRPSLALSGFDEPYFTRWQQRYRSMNRDTWVLDLTTDLGIPSVVAVSYRTDKPAQDVLMGFGAHFDVRVAISRAMTEMNQFLPAVMNMTADSDDYSFADALQRHWWRTATIDNQPYLAPSAEPARTAADCPRNLASDDLGQDIRTAQRIVEEAGMELLILDQTRPDIGLPVVKVVVPGMRHFWARYGPGRLYDVPVRLGWRGSPTPETDLNPIAMFL